MVRLLRATWRSHNLLNASRHNPGEHFVPCLAHVIHNVVLAFLTSLSVKPAELNGIFEREEEYGVLQADEEVESQDEEFSRPHVRITFPSLDRMDRFEQTLAKIREISKASRNSTQRSEEFQTLVIAFRSKPLELKLDVKTRWHSTALMLERALQLREPIDQWVRRRPELEKLHVSAREWVLIKVVLSALYPFWQATNLLIQGKGVTIPLPLGIYNFLYDRMEDIEESLKQHSIETSTGYGSTPYKDQLLKAMGEAKKKLAKYYLATDKVSTYAAACLLTPYLKGSLFEHGSWAVEEDETPYLEIYVEKLKEYFRENYVEPGASNSQSGDSSAPDSRFGTPASSNSIVPIPFPLNRKRLTQAMLFGSAASGGTRTQKDPMTELNDYLAAEPVALPDNDDPWQASRITMAYWRGKEEVWPHLTRMARDVLAAPATGVDVERLFSQGRSAINHHRHKLHDKTISNIMFYRSAVARERKSLNPALPISGDALWQDVDELASIELQMRNRPRNLFDHGSLFGDRPEHLREALDTLDGLSNSSNSANSNNTMVTRVQQSQSDNQTDDDEDEDLSTPTQTQSKRQRRV